MTNSRPTIWPSSSSHQSAFGYVLMSPRPSLNASSSLAAEIRRLAGKSRLADHGVTGLEARLANSCHVEGRRTACRCPRGRCCSESNPIQSRGRNRAAAPTGPSADGSLVPIDTSGVGASYRQANERYREDGQDDVAHASLLKEEPSQPPSISKVKFPLTPWARFAAGPAVRPRKEHAQGDRPLEGMSAERLAA
jgi:hypothetical protein